MTNYGTEVSIAYPDLNTKQEEINIMWAGEVKNSFKRYTVRTKVYSKQEETAEFLKFSDLIEQKKNARELLYRHSDVTLLPSFVIEYPKKDFDGSYFIITSYTLVLL